MSSYSFSDAAIQDLNEICEYIAQNNPSAVSRLFDAIRQSKNCESDRIFASIFKKAIAS